VLLQSTPLQSVPLELQSLWQPPLRRQISGFNLPTLLQPPSLSAKPGGGAAFNLGFLVETCIKRFGSWPAAATPQVQLEFSPALVPHRLGDEAGVGLVLLQLLYLAGQPTGALHLWVDPCVHNGRDVRFEAGPRARAGDPGSAHVRLPAHTVESLSGGADMPRNADALGPALLRALVTRQGGALGLASDGEHGLRLRCDLVLPVDLRAAQAGQVGPSAPLRVLLVEDHPVNAEMTTDMLQRSGDIEVVLAGTGEDALKLALQQAFDVVLMDMFLPDSDGVVVARRLTRMLGDSAPPMIALTANAYPSDRELCLQAGMVDFLSKPVGLAALTAAVRRWGQWHRGRGLETGSDFADKPAGER